MRPQAVVFDAYGTLFDVHAAVVQAALLDRDQGSVEFIRRQLRIDMTEPKLDGLCGAIFLRRYFPDVRPALESLNGLRFAILSNGSRKMVESAVSHSDLQSIFVEIISVDRADLQA